MLNNINLHKLLRRQLKKQQLDYSLLPSDLEKWQNFLNYVNKSYINADEERYLMNRSIEISSRESMEIYKRKQEAMEKERLRRDLMDSVRQHGMADVAISILHNVGNVLNSANVSINLLNENINQPFFQEFFDVCSLIRDNSANIQDYLLNDENGKFIPEYLASVVPIGIKGYTSIQEELNNLHEKIKHIKQIVASQHSITAAGDNIEYTSLKDIMDSSLKMVGYPFSEHEGIMVKKDYQENISLYIDRAKLTQIIVNLIRNAKEALINDISHDKIKTITLTIKQSNADKNIIEMCIIDNGIGISAENIKKIFSYGYSTKKDGHGIGLHSSALVAKDIGAKINTASDGVGKGAIFTLEVPKTSNRKQT